MNWKEAIKQSPLGSATIKTDKFFLIRYADGSAIYMEIKKGKVGKAREASEEEKGSNDWKPSKTILFK